MTTYQAPAKLNLTLLVSPPGDDGYHPLESLVQTVEWCDLLHVRRGEEGGDIIETDIDDDIVERAIAELRRTAAVPALAITLDKEIPVAAGLGGGSSDAAAALLAAAEQAGLSRSGLVDIALRIGADVPLFLTGGTVMMRGRGEQIEEVRLVEDFAAAIAVPDFGLSTTDVYKRWDSLEGPIGDPVLDDLLPPSLRGGMPMRNDLLPAAIDLDPRLGDFMADLRAQWGTPVCLTGSGSACFGYFATVDEASDAADSVAGLAHVGRGVALRDRGVAPVEDDDESNGS